MELLFLLLEEENRKVLVVVMETLDPLVDLLDGWEVLELAQAVVQEDMERLSVEEMEKLTLEETQMEELMEEVRDKVSPI